MSRLVAALRVDDIDECKTRGAFEFAADDKGMFYICPCGCGREGYLPFREANNEHPSWRWDGNRDQPTLNPSVHHIIAEKTHWHGWLRAGVWESC